MNDEPLDDLLEDKRRTTWVCGPGLGQDAAREALPKLLAAGRQVLADADALGAHAGHPEALRGVAVLTPHEGEFAKLFGPSGTDRLAAARAAAARVGAVVLLKGSDTVVAAPDGRASINATGTSALATAGAGDVLSGLIGALLAGGMPAWGGRERRCLAARLPRGKMLGRGLVAEDLPAAIARAIQRRPAMT